MPKFHLCLPEQSQPVLRPRWFTLLLMRVRHRRKRTVDRASLLYMLYPVLDTREKQRTPHGLQCYQSFEPFMYGLHPNRVSRGCCSKILTTVCPLVHFPLLLSPLLLVVHNDTWNLLFSHFDHIRGCALRVVLARRDDHMQGGNKRHREREAGSAHVKYLRFVNWTR